MMIRCTLIRKGGTVVTIDDEIYHFKPHMDSQGHHVAEVTNTKHIGRLLGITEAYEVSDLPSPPQVDAETPVSRPPSVIDLMSNSALAAVNYGATAVDTKDPQGGPDLLHVKADKDKLPEPETKGFTRSMLNNMAKEDLLDEFGRGTEMGLKVDRRSKKENLVELIASKLGL